MEKNLYWEVTDNAEMSVTVHDLPTAMQIIEINQKETKLEVDEELLYTLTPVYLTEQEYSELGESENY